MEYLFVYDIIDNNGKITQEFILHKLKNKFNWISEFSFHKQAFPKNWIDILKTESSVKINVNFKKDYFIWSNQFINLTTLPNYLVYNKLVNEENKLKLFRWKLLHFIISNKVFLFKWKIVGNSLCNLCK